MKRSFRTFLYEYFAAVVVQVAIVLVAAAAHSSFAQVLDGLASLVLALGIFALPVGFIRILLSYCEQAGMTAHGLAQWLLRFAYWVPLAYIFHQTYLDYCFVNPGQGVFLGCSAALVTGAGSAIGDWIEKKRGRPNKPPLTTRTFDPPV